MRAYQLVLHMNQEATLGSLADEFFANEASKCSRGKSLAFYSFVVNDVLVAFKNMVVKLLECIQRGEFEVTFSLAKDVTPYEYANSVVRELVTFEGNLCRLIATFSICDTHAAFKLALGRLSVALELEIKKAAFPLSSPVTRRLMADALRETRAGVEAELKAEQAKQATLQQHVDSMDFSIQFLQNKPPEMMKDLVALRNTKLAELNQCKTKQLCEQLKAFDLVLEHFA